MKQAQPHRATASRRQTPALAAMTRGKPRYIRSVADIKRAAVRKKRKKRGKKAGLPRVMAMRSDLTHAPVRYPKKRRLHR